MSDLTRPFQTRLPTRPLKRLARLATNKTDGSSRQYVGLENIESWTGRFLESDAGEETDGVSVLFESNDVLFGKLRPYLAKVALATNPGRCTAEFLVLRANEIEPRFLQYALLAEPFIDAVNASTFGAKMPRADWEFISHVEVPTPTRPAQRAIADYLDRMTGAIDTLFAKKERLIELLEEKRQALITRAVTKGLGSPSMKVTKSPYLRVIPRAWELCPLKRCLEYGPKNGISPPPALAGRGVPSFSISAVRDGRVDIVNNLKEVDLPVTEARKYSLRTGDILIVRGNGNLDMVGAAGMAEEVPVGCTYPDILMLVRAGGRVDGSFLVAALNSPYIRAQVELSARTSNGTYKVAGDDIANLHIALPPLDEQARIRDHLLSLFETHRRLRVGLQRQVNLLREYRQALITAAVTGKIDLTKDAA